jgi:adenine-specific DNA methylase
MSDKRENDLKIQDDLPIRAVGIETQRERRNFSDLPPQNYIHVWWARRPTPASRLGILSSILPDSVDDDKLLMWMGIDPDNNNSDTPIAEHVRKKRSTKDKRDGSVYEHYGYRKSYKNLPDNEEIRELHDIARDTWDDELPTILDATAGGGSIPFESVRYELPTIANELNPVASVILKAVLEHPRVDGDLSEDIRKWGMEIGERSSEELSDYFPASQGGREPLTYLWANTITCPDCGTEIPMSPNWWIDRQENIAVKPNVENMSVSFELVDMDNEDDYNPTSAGTVSRGDGDCLNCKVTIEGDEIKRQAQEGETGYQIYCIEYRDEYTGDRGNFRAPNEEDQKAFQKAKENIKNDFEMSTFLSIEIPDGEETARTDRFGIYKWRDMFAPRQLLSHYTYWKKFEEVKPKIKEKYPKAEAEVILTFLSMAGDKALNYNSRYSGWHPARATVQNTFDRHDFAYMWSFAENNQAGKDIGYEWCLENSITAYQKLRDLSGDRNTDIDVLQEDASNLPLDDESVEAVILDPPYYDNVMYAELSDFFYVWLKKYLGDVYPEFFETELTPKDDEAVANESKFDEVAVNKSKSELAEQDYEEKMSDIFDEMHRVLDDEGIFTLMFTHKKTEAWDTLTKALINAGFVVTATHPVSTESQHSLHQKGKNAAESTILLASEKRDKEDETPTLYEDIQRETRRVARQKAKELDEREVDFAKVDIILASFGPTLEVFTENYPVVDDEGNEVSPQEALDEARTAVNDYLIEKYLNEGVKDVDSVTEWYLLSWLVFEAERFPYDEARRLAIGVGEDMDSLKKSHRLWRKKSDDVVLRGHDERVYHIDKDESSRSSRVTKVEPEKSTFSTAIDKVHATMHVYDVKGAREARGYIQERNFDKDADFKATLEALLRLLPHSPDNTHDDWEIAQEIASGKTGEMLELDLDRQIFQERYEEGEKVQTKLGDSE